MTSTMENPEIVAGFENYPHAREALAAGLRENVFPGFVAGIWRASDADRFEVSWGGVRRLRLKGLDRLPMERDTVFDLASVSKVFATASLATSLVERGWIRWDTEVRAILPEFRHDGITLRMLAAHTSGLPAWFPFFSKISAAFGGDELGSIAVEDRQAVMRTFCFEVDLDRAPGTKAVYSDIGFLLLGFCLEEVLGMSLDRAVPRFLWRPMGLIESARRRGERGPYYFRTTEAAFRIRDEQVAATEDCPWRKTILQGQVHDDNCWAMGGYGGHAGVFGTATDLLSFGKNLLSGYFSRETLREAWTRVNPPEECDRTPGWDTPSGDAPAFGKLFSASSVGHLGFTGTSLWIDPENRCVVVLLTNRVHPSRENPLIRAFRGRYHDALARDLGLGKPS
jgi:CubicO group peptidase (beta-lactamase class C family)